MKQRAHQSLSFQFKDGANRFGELSTAYAIFYAAFFLHFFVAWFKRVLKPQRTPSNFVIIFAADIGYVDVDCFESKDSITP